MNSGTTTATCPGTGSVTAHCSAIVDGARQRSASGTATTPANPVFAWIYRDQSKVFVLEISNGIVYVVSASKYKVTNTIAVGGNPIKAAQSTDGQYIYVLNTNGYDLDHRRTGGDSGGHGHCHRWPDDPRRRRSISHRTRISTTPSRTRRYNHIWVLQADGTVSVYGRDDSGTVDFDHSLSTITPAQLTAGVYPTNLALMRDGTEAYVGLGNTDQIVGINTSMLATGGAITSGATTAITLECSPAESVAGTSPDADGHGRQPTCGAGGIHGANGEQYCGLPWRQLGGFVEGVCGHHHEHDLLLLRQRCKSNDRGNADPWDGTSSFIVSGCTDLAGQFA